VLGSKSFSDSPAPAKNSQQEKFVISTKIYRVVMLANICMLVAGPILGQTIRKTDRSRLLYQLPREAGQPNQVRDLEFAPSGKVLGFAADKTVRTIGISKDPTPKVIVQNKEHSIGDIAFSSTGEELASAGFLYAVVANLSTGKTRQLDGSSAVAWSPDSALIALGDYGWNSHVIDRKSDETRFKMNPFAGVGPADTGLLKPTTVQMSFSSDGKLLAAVTDFWDDELPGFVNIQLWDVASGKLRFSLRGGRCQFSPDSGLLAYRSYAHSGDGRIMLLDLDSYLIVGALTGRYEDLRYGPDGKSIAAVSDDSVEVWSITPEGKRRVCKRTLRLDHPQTVSALALTPDGKTLATADESGAIRLWDLAD